MKTLKNILLSAALAAGTVLGAYAQQGAKEGKQESPVDNRPAIINIDSANLLTYSQADTTILQSFFQIKDLTVDQLDMADKTYHIDANGKAVDAKGKHYPDKIIPFSNFTAFEQLVMGYDQFVKTGNGVKKVHVPPSIKPSKIPGQTLDKLTFEDLWAKDGLLKLGEYDPSPKPYNNSNIPCQSDCDEPLTRNPLEQDLLQYFSSLMNKYSAVCVKSSRIDTKTQKPINGIVAPLNGLITAEETHILNEKARKVLKQYPGKYGLVFGVSELNEGYVYSTRDNLGNVVRNLMPAQNVGYIVGILPPQMIEGPKGYDFFKEKDLIIDGAIEDPIVPCDACGDDDKKAKKKSDDQTGVYFGLGIGKNNRWDIIIPNIALGGYVGNFGVGLNAGFAKGKGIETTIFNGPQGGYPNGLYTKTDVNNETSLTQFGGELSYRIFDGRLVLYAGAQKNIVNKESTSGIVETRVVDGNNNPNMTRNPMAANTLPADIDADYVTFNLGGGIRVVKNLDIIVQGKFNSGLNEVSGGVRYSIPIKSNY
ncbi:MAG TPA: hypothetical protein VEC16_03715 [Alphaproteobacteria bacterium]|nr:hypothetical protein [Alphaproteobacteria bacterium]